MVDRKKFLKRLRDFENQVRDDEMKGSFHPDDREYVHSRYKVLRERLIEFVCPSGGQ